MTTNEEKPLFPTKTQLMADWSKKPIEVATNHYTISFDNDQLFNQWQLSFIDKEDIDLYMKDPNAVQEAIPPESRNLISEIRKANGKDLKAKIDSNFMNSMVLYSISRWPIEDDIIILNNHPMYVMIINIIKKNISFDDLINTIDENCKRDLVKFLNMNIEHVMYKQNYTEWGRDRNYFNLSNRINISKRNLMIFDGFKANVGLVEKGIRLLFDCTNKIVRFNNMWDDFLNQEIGTGNHDRICDFFIGKSIMANYGQNRVYRIDDIDFLTTPMSAFPHKEFKNYEEYFMTKYGVPKLKYPDQFMLVHKSRVVELANEGKKQIRFETIYLVPELMLATGLSDGMKGDSSLLDDLSEYRQKDPKARFDDIEKLISSINGFKDEQTSFNFKINPKDNKVTAYKLEYPSLKVGDTKIIPQGDKIELNQLANGKTIDNWILVVDYKNEKDYGLAIDLLSKAGLKYNLKVNQPRTVITLPKNSSVDTVEKLMRKQKLKAKPALIFFLVGDSTARFLYKKAKAFYNSKGIPTQFFVSFSANKDNGDLSKYDGLLLQMVAKLGGSIWEVETDRSDMVIAGVDVAHVDDKNAVVSIACQMGVNFTNHYSLVTKQKKGAQIMNGVYKMVMDSIKHYVRRYDKLPKHYVIFRKGVTCRSYDDLIEFEINRIIESLETIYDKKAPKLSYVVVDTRIDNKFAINSEEGLKNPNTGIVVLDGVVERDRANFYLVSQNVSRGSAHPTHYQIIYNNGDLKMNDIVDLSYSATFGFVNRMGATRVPSMVQNANKLSRLVGISQNDEIEEHLKERQFYL